MTEGDGDERRSGRSRVMLTAAIDSGGESFPVRIDDLSAHGARVVGAALPAIDAPITFRCNGLTVDGFVAWVQEPLAGIGFGRPVQPEDVLRKIPPPRQVVPMDFRRPGLRARQLTEEERKIVEQWASIPRIRPGE